MALIFGVVFAGLGFGISIVYEKFLSMDTNAASLDGDSVSGDSGAQASSAPRKGQAVDIVIRDEDLPSDENSNAFTIGSNRLLLNNEDLEKRGQGSNYASNGITVNDSQKAVNSLHENQNSVVEEVRNANSAAIGSSDSSDRKPGESEPDKSFVPVRNLETLYNVSGKEAVKKDSVGNTSNAGATEERTSGNYSAADENLDTLPDMDNIDFTDDDGIAGNSAGGGEVIEASFSAASSVSDSGSGPEVKDASLIAKAISTVLAKES